MRIAAVGLQTDLDRQLLEIGRRQSAAAGFFPNPQDILFVDVEIDVDRIELHDGRKLCRRRRADQLADRNEMRADNAVERRNHVGVAVIDRRNLGVDLGLLQVRLRIIA